MTTPFRVEYFFSRFITDLFINGYVDHGMLTRIFGKCDVWEFDEEEDRVAETWYIWTGYKDGQKFTIIHKRNGVRYDGPPECLEFAKELIIKQKWKESVKSC